MLLRSFLNVSIVVGTVERRNRTIPVDIKRLIFGHSMDLEVIVKEVLRRNWRGVVGRNGALVLKECKMKNCRKRSDAQKMEGEMRHGR